MKYNDLRDFIDQLEKLGELKRISVEVDPHLEMTEICDRTLRAGGPALLFENPKGYDMPVLANLFGTPKRVALGMGQDNVTALRDIGKLLAFLKEPDPPKGFRDAIEKLPLFRQVMRMSPKVLRSAPCQDVVIEKDQVDLYQIPVQHCWPGDAGPLVTWPLVITRGPHKERQNLGIYRQQVIGRNRLIMRWLSHRGGALDFQEFQKSNPGQPYPVAVALGADPAPRPARLLARAGDDSGGGDAGAGYVVGIRLCRAASRQPDRAGQGGAERSAGAGKRRNRAGRFHLPG